jgi:hypothetical protein
LAGEEAQETSNAQRSTPNVELNKMHRKRVMMISDASGAAFAACAKCA